MERRIEDTIKHYNMIEKEDMVIVAVSGGPDSMCLLHALYLLSSKLYFSLAAAHVNHCLRGEEADKDEEYVREKCREYNIPFYSRRIDIEAMSRSRGISTETAGREARYDFFEELLKEHKAQKIALAHNANDQAETLLMRLMRGTGLSGLEGIKPVRDKIFIRPLITISREDIEDYCERNELHPRIDKTNMESIYSRNKIRLELIPYMRKNFNEDIITALNRANQLLTRDAEYLENMAKKSYELYCEKSLEKVIIKNEALNEHSAILSRIIRTALEHIAGGLNNFEEVHIEAIMNCFKLSSGKRVELPRGYVALREKDGVSLVHKRSLEVHVIPKGEYELPIGHTLILKDQKLKITVDRYEAPQLKSFKGSEYTRYFSGDCVKRITLRYRREGDRFTPFGMKGSRKLKDYFMDLKLPLDKRNETPLICFDGNIAWIVGYRTSEEYKISDKTKIIIVITAERED